MNQSYEGMGGSYELMPDGTKRLRERTAEAEPQVAQPADAPAEVAAAEVVAGDESTVQGE